MIQDFSMVARVRLCPVPFAFLMNIAKLGAPIHGVCFEGIPEGAKILNAGTDANGFVMLLEHESYEPIAGGQQIPLQFIKYGPFPEEIQQQQEAQAVGQPTPLSRAERRRQERQSRKSPVALRLVSDAEAVTPLT